MKYNNASKLLAEEAWRMITDDCKEKMILLKEPYIKSLTEDISHFINKTQEDFAIKFAKWIDVNYICYNGIYNKRTDPYWNSNDKTIEDVLDEYKQKNL